MLWLMTFDGGGMTRHYWMILTMKCWIIVVIQMLGSAEITVMMKKE
jgi:hypothetical protein